jgi:hypothetical protein
MQFLSKPANIERLTNGLAHVHEASQADLDKFKVTSRQLANDKEFKQYTYGKLKVIPDHLDHYLPSLSCMTGTGILDIIARATAETSVPVVRKLEFANDSLFCEWAYVVNLDQQLLEVFRSGEDKTIGHRFEHVGPHDAMVPGKLCEITFFALEDMIEEEIHKFCALLQSRSDEKVSKELLSDIALKVHGLEITYDDDDNDEEEGVSMTAHDNQSSRSK